MNPETRPLFLQCTADGKRFLMTTNSEASEGESAPVTVVLNRFRSMFMKLASSSDRDDLRRAHSLELGIKPEDFLQLRVPLH
jgi:hypothetical protein